MVLETPLTTGSIVTIWHGNRGLLYVVAGINRSAKTLDLIKHNCFNSDGSIHKSTKARATRRFGVNKSPFHKTVSFESLDEEGLEGIRIAGKVNRVHGQKTVDVKGLATFVRAIAGSRTCVQLKPEHSVYPSLDAIDARLPSNFH